MDLRKTQLTESQLKKIDGKYICSLTEGVVWPSAHEDYNIGSPVV